MLVPPAFDQLPAVLDTVPFNLDPITMSVAVMLWVILGPTAVTIYQAFVAALAAKALGGVATGLMMVFLYVLLVIVAVVAVIALLAAVVFLITVTGLAVVLSRLATGNGKKVRPRGGREAGSR